MSYYQKRFPKQEFIIGITDDVTYKSLEAVKDFHIDEKSIECIFKISSFMTYTINDSDSYNTWKKENIERLLN